MLNPGCAIASATPGTETTFDARDSARPELVFRLTCACAGGTRHTRSR